jgi:hypothetical protein
MNWPELLATAIEKGYLAMGAFPMSALYEGSSTSAVNHAVVAYGLRYDGKRLSFLIHDPLKRDNRMTASDQLIRNASEDPTIVVVSNEHMQRSRQIRILDTRTTETPEGRSQPSSRSVRVLPKQDIKGGRVRILPKKE